MVSTNIDKDVKKCLLEKKYSSKIGDITIGVPANSTSTEAYIYKRNQSNKYIQTNFIDPREPAINDIHLLRTGEHCQPIVPDSFIFEGKYCFNKQFIILHIYYFLNFLLSVQCCSLFMYRNQLAV